MGNREGIDFQDTVLCRLSHQPTKPESPPLYLPSAGVYSAVKAKCEFMSETYAEGNSLLQYFSDHLLTSLENALHS